MPSTLSVDRTGVRSSAAASALAILASSYTTGRSVAWVEGLDIQQWDQPFRHLADGLGSRDTASPDLLSLLMFVPEYRRTLIEIGEADAEARAGDIAALVERA